MAKVKFERRKPTVKISEIGFPSDRQNTTTIAGIGKFLGIQEKLKNGKPLSVFVIERKETKK